MKQPKWIYYTEVKQNGKLLDARVSFHPQQYRQLQMIHNKFSNARAGNEVFCVRMNMETKEWEPFPP